MKEKQIEFSEGTSASKGILLIPGRPRKTTVILAHGAGNDMHSDFMTFFHRRIAEKGYPSLKFNFFYMQAGRKAPDREELLLSCFRKAMEACGSGPLVLGGKSMGGRMASYLGTEPQVTGLLFLGYPLHPPGKTSQLRDQHLYSIRKPMLFVSGSRDPFAQGELLQSVLKKIGRHADYFEIPGGGHSFEVPKKSGHTTAEMWERADEAIERWLESKFD